MSSSDFNFGELAPSPEAARITQAIGMWRNACAECERRIENLRYVIDADFDTESTFLTQWADDLEAEERRLHMWARDVQQRQIQRGELVVQVDGSFKVGTPRVAAHKKAMTGVGRGFWRTHFRNKVGLLGLAFLVLGCIGASAGVVGLEVLGVFGLLMLMLWFVSGLFGGGAGATAPAAGGPTALDQQQRQEQAQAQADLVDRERQLAQARAAAVPSSADDDDGDTEWGSRG
jgi:hypothetical protein